MGLLVPSPLRSHQFHAVTRLFRAVPDFGLTQLKETLIMEIARGEVIKAFNREPLQEDEEDPEVKRADFETFRRVLYKYRTPGQPFCATADLKELWELCDKGNFKLFLEVLYAPEESEPQEGSAAKSRRRAQAEAPMFHYPATTR